MNNRYRSRKDRGQAACICHPASQTCHAWQEHCGIADGPLSRPGKETMKQGLWLSWNQLLSLFWQDVQIKEINSISSACAWQFSTFKELEPYSAGGARDTRRDSADCLAPPQRTSPSDSGLSFGDLVSGSSYAMSDPRSSLHSCSPHESITSADICCNSGVVWGACRPVVLLLLLVSCRC